MLIQTAFLWNISLYGFLQRRFYQLLEGLCKPHVAGDHVRQAGAKTGSHAAVERAGQQGGEHDHNIAGVEIAAGHGWNLDDERRHAAQRYEHGGVDEISEFLVHNITLFLLVAQGYDIRHK